ncbi:MAG: M48 family metalloprotease, partial [Syntrophorhabdaceae bacterium]|nr:M48 family metalloprotease [Syntrophorhabdaceae bacterium]
MNVYDHITANTRKTVGILCAFPAVLFVTVYAFAVLMAAADEAAYVLEEALRITLVFYPLMILAVAAWIVISFYTGDRMILGETQARRVTFEENRDLFRLVENTAIMAGLPVPEIYLIDDGSLNAFATGRNPKKASIALTKGLVEKLDKAELQAVI